MRYLLPLLFALGASAATADLSDRERDLRLDTSAQAGADPAPKAAPRLSTRSETRKPPYAYASPYGVGPYNDSR
jgi:hypothetical protein